MISRDIEANFSHANDTPVDLKEDVVCDTLLHVKISNKDGKRIVMAEEVALDPVQQEIEPFHIKYFLCDVCQNIRKGDVKTISKVGVVFLATHGFVKLFI